MKNKNWFKGEKNDFFKQKRSKEKDEFTSERALKLAGGLVLVGVGTAVAIDLLEDL